LTTLHGYRLPFENVLTNTSVSESLSPSSVPECRIEEQTDWPDAFSGSVGGRGERGNGEEITRCLLGDGRRWSDNAGGDNHSDARTRDVWIKWPRGEMRPQTAAGARTMIYLARANVNYEFAATLD